MTTHVSRPSRKRLAARCAGHYLEMVAAMVAGMFLLAVPWSWAWPAYSGNTVVHTLVMAANMTIGMAAWMRVRRHSWPRIAEMSAAMVAPFVLLLLPYWFGVLPGGLLSSLGHGLMFVSMALAMWWRRDEYAHHHRPAIPRRVLRGAVVVLAALLVPGAVSAVNTVGKFGDRYEARPDQVAIEPAPRSAGHDPAKPTVALLAASSGTNAADLLGPYETLASTGRMNTYVVSAGARTVPLTGGLDLVPDLTFDALARLLRGHGDRLDAVVIPALQEPDAAEQDSITAWLRQQAAAGALTVSVCNGARTLAATGLLDGRSATSHWWRLPGLRDDFGDVDWVSGRRYVEDGTTITTAGVLSGIDGSLRILERLVGADVAAEAARHVGWRHYSPGAAGPIPVSSWEPQDLAVVALNSSYQTGPSTIGVRLTEGVGELELASAFVSYTEQSMIGRTVAVGDGPIRSEHGLTFVPRSTPGAAAGELDRLLVPGHAAARNRAAGTEPAEGTPAPVYLHVADEFPFDPVLRDIARTYDVPTARFAAKTLEYPVLDVELSGSGWPWQETIVALLLALLGAAAATVTGVLLRRRRARSRPGQDAQPLASPGTGRELIASP